MQDQQKPQQQRPADIAREAFRQLAARRIAPTPDAYRDIYEEIAGTTALSDAEKVLADFAVGLSTASGDLAPFAALFNRAVETRDWQAYGQELNQFIERHLKQIPPAGRSGDSPQDSNSLIGAGKAASETGEMPESAKSNSIPLVDEPAPARNKTGAIPLVDESTNPGKSASTAFPLVEEGDSRPAKSSREPENSKFSALAGDNPQARLLRELLVRTLTLAVGSLLQGVPDLARESEQLASSIRDAGTEQSLNDISARLKQFCFRIELKSADMAEEHELLLRLFKLLLENVSELLDDDSWLSGQIASVQVLLAGPLTHSALMDATRSLKEVIYKQGLLKHSLSEAKISMKNMMITFVDRLSAVAASTGDYHQKIGTYAQKISKAQGIPELNKILEDVMHDTKIAQTEALRSRDDMLAARQAVQEAEARIQELESKLEQMSELVREDQLTGSLNRRGLDDVFEREFARAERRNSPLCIAMLDLDDFKRLNDTYGHTAGDEALIHLVRVIKDTLRTMDVIARFGGEEFLIVLPDTPLGEAKQTVTRVQRELTKRIFMHNHERLLITFSAGVALREPHEEQTSLIMRADEALYKAKKAGKNRVIAAE